MNLSRRALLAGAGGLAASTVAGVAGAKPSRPRRTQVKAFTDGVGMRDYSMVVGGGTAPRFPGDPGVGKVMTGGNRFTGDWGSFGTGPSDGVTWLNDNTGVNHVIEREFYKNLWSRTDISNTHDSQGRFPFPSFKCIRTINSVDQTPQEVVDEINAGGRDSALAAEAVWAASEGYPIFTTFWHEPEDFEQSNGLDDDFRAAYRRIVGIFRDNGADNVVWATPVFQGVFDFGDSGTTPAVPSGGEGTNGPWYQWDPDWKGTLSGSGGTRPNASDWWVGSDSVTDLHGFDMYDPIVGGSLLRGFSTVVETQIFVRMAADGRDLSKPWIIAEFGTGRPTYSGPTTNPDVAYWTDWYQDAFQCMSNTDCIGFSTYNTDGRNFVDGFDGTTGSAERLAGYEAALASEASYLVTVRPT